LANYFAYRLLLAREEEHSVVAAVLLYGIVEVGANFLRIGHLF
jgi:hypothetical protein